MNLQHIRVYLELIACHTIVKESNIMNFISQFGN